MKDFEDLKGLAPPRMEILAIDNVDDFFDEIMTPKLNPVLAQIQQFVNENDLFGSLLERGIAEEDMNFIKTIGNKLNDLGGFYLMLFVCESLPREIQPYINAAWDGIGVWFA